MCALEVELTARYDSIENTTRNTITMKCKISALRHNRGVPTCGWLSATTTNKTQISIV